MATIAIHAAAPSPDVHNVIATGLTLEATQELLDWLNANGVHGCLVTYANGGFQVCLSGTCSVCLDRPAWLF